MAWIRRKAAHLFGVFLFEQPDGIVVRLAVQLLLPVDAAIGIEIEDVTVRDDPGITLRGELLAQLLPKFRFRFGVLRIAGEGPVADWDGTVNGRNVQSNVYVYQFIMRTRDGRTENTSGDLLVLF